MKRMIVLGAIALAAVLGGSVPSFAEQHGTAGVSAATQLRQDMRKLWTDHVIWTRDYIVAAVGDQPDAQAAAARLLKHQEDIGAAIAGVYGKPAGDQLTTLLKEHITIAVDIIKFAKAGDKANQQQADAKWHRNAEQIADFLAKANPNWPKATVLDMLNQHLALTTQEATAQLQGRWAESASSFDQIFTQILGMADALSDGIVKQFPNRF